MSSCARCQRDLSAENPVRLHDTREYCAACCASMATDAFEMETGEPFVKWIEKHPKLDDALPADGTERAAHVVYFSALSSPWVESAWRSSAAFNSISAELPAIFLAAYMAAVCVLAGSVYFVIKNEDTRGHRRRKSRREPACIFVARRGDRRHLEIRPIRPRLFQSVIGLGRVVRRAVRRADCRPTCARRILN